MKKYFIFLVLIVITMNVNAQIRYKQSIFTSMDSIKNVTYGEAINLEGVSEKLLLDVYTPPTLDTVTKRPLVLFVHGGGFRNNTKMSGIINRLGISLAKKGFVVASIDYRLGVDKSNTDVAYQEAMFRAQQDGKAAVRFFRRYATTYEIDTSQIFLTGSSAGSMTILAMAYMDENEVPAAIDQKKWGSLEGNSGNEGYSSKVNGVMNFWGSIIDYKWIKKGDVPLFNIAGTADKTVPYDSSFSYHSLKYGAFILYQHCLRLGVPTGWVPFVGSGHTLDGKRNLLDSAQTEMESWLYTQLKTVAVKSPEPTLRWETDIKKFDSLNTVEKYSDSAVLFLGSSYIRYWKNIREDLNYPSIIHRGFGGSNLRDVAYYVRDIVYPHTPKAIFMYVGNDIVDSEKDKSPIQVLELFKFVVQEIRVKNPSIPITWLQISPSEKRWGVWDKVQQANLLIEDYTKTEPGLNIIRFSEAFLNEKGLPKTEYYRTDKLHYNDAGYKVWGEAIKEKVHQIITSSKK